MRQRHSFRASEWESLEGRQLLTTAPTPVPFPNLAFYLLAFDQKHATTPTGTPGGTSTGSGGNPQPQTIVTPPPPGFLDGRVTLTRNDVTKLSSAVHNFVMFDTGGINPFQDKAATASFLADLKSFDSFVSTEQHLPAGVTSSLITPLLNDVPLTMYELQNLRYTIDTFAASETYNASGISNNTVALVSLESSLNLLISSHPK